MLSILHSDFFINLVIINGFLLAIFLVINYRYHQLVEKIESITAASRNLDEKQKKILKRFFPYYKKLSPNFQRIFEQKLLYFYYTKKYETVNGLELFDRMKLFISAYAAQVSLGFKGYGFSQVDKVVIHSRKFYSEKKKTEVCWELDHHGVLNLSWEDFFEQLKKEVVLPIGLEIMAHAIKKDDNELVKDQIFESRYLLFHQVSHSDPNALVRNLFREEHFINREDFLEACIKNYFSHPVELKNNFPDLFKKLDKLFYSQIRLT